MDEVYITAGLKGQAGGLLLERDPRRRGLKRRDRGDWNSDRLPVFGLLCRGGEVRLFVSRNVQTKPIICTIVATTAAGIGPLTCCKPSFRSMQPALLTCWSGSTRPSLRSYALWLAESPIIVRINSLAGFACRETKFPSVYQRLGEHHAVKPCQTFVSGYTLLYMSAILFGDE